MSVDGMENKTVCSYDEENVMFKGRTPISNVGVGKDVFIYFEDGTFVNPQEVAKIAKEFKAQQKKWKSIISLINNFTYC